MLSDLTENNKSGVHHVKDNVFGENFLVVNEFKKHINIIIL